MKLHYILTRYNDLYDFYIGGRGKKWLFFLDWLVCLVFYGASVNDYFAYCFYKLRPAGKNEFITYRRYHKIQRVCNDVEKRQIFRDKSLFNKTFSKYLHREALDLNTASEQQFVDFFSRHGEIFVKEVMGFRGSSVKLYSLSDVDPAHLYAELKSDPSLHYIAENRLVENHELASFHPYSVNTIRLVTVLDDKTGEVAVMSARIRIGNKGNNVDNFHFEGIGANIDIETGIINSVGYNSRDEEFMTHPMTGKQIMGFQMPKWKECKEFVYEVARIVPEVRYVGWDIVLLENGEFALIEANDNADHDFQQMHYRGMWKDYKRVLHI